VTDAIKGLWVALATPLGPDGMVDTAGMVRHAQSLLADGCDGIVLFGTTGEGTSFSAAERLAATEAMLKSGIAAERLALGTGCPAITDTIALTRAMRGIGLTHALMLPPYFYRDATDEGVGDAFSAVIEKLADPDLRVTLYHIPQTSGVAIAPAVAARLRGSFGAVVAGLKDSSGDFAQFGAFRAGVPELPVLVGNEADIGRALAEGGVGTICGMANLVPALVRAMFTEADAGGPMNAALALMKGPFLPVLKSALAARTGQAGWRRVRPPLTAASEAAGQEVARGVAALVAGRAA
jgi:4-hydroxy-tetrahydrodipicolinate synthase